MEDLNKAFSPSKLRDLDSEGRCVITDHSTFILFNVYFPCYSSKRADFKADFSRAIQLRIDSFIQSGRSVVLAADVNVMHKEIDCYNIVEYLRDHDMDSLLESPIRQWFDSWIETTMTDSFRHFHPEKPHVYTVWNTRENKRPANHGTRIDYILSSRDLVSKFCDTFVESHIMGSDHAPVVSTLNDCLLVRYVDAKPPKGCTFYWKNYGEKQKTLDSFFSKSYQDSDSASVGGLAKASSFEMLEKIIGPAVKNKKPSSKGLAKASNKQQIGKDKSQKSILAFVRK